MYKLDFCIYRKIHFFEPIEGHKNSDAVELSKTVQLRGGQQSLTSSLKALRSVCNSELPRGPMPNFELDEEKPPIKTGDAGNHQKGDTENPSDAQDQVKKDECQGAVTAPKGNTKLNPARGWGKNKNTLHGKAQNLHSKNLRIEGINTSC